MTLSRRSIADQIDRLDEEIGELQKEKAVMFGAYREELEKGGVARSAVKAEVAALKGAIQRRRKIAADPAAIEQLDALVDEILTEIQGLGGNGTVPALRARHAREDDGLDIPASLRREARP